MEMAEGESGLVKKLKLKAGQRAGFIHAPKGYLKEMGPLPARVEAVEGLSGKFDWLQVFVKNKAEMDALAPRVAKAIKPDSLCWISFPKGSSKIQTDLTRDKGWEALPGAGLEVGHAGVGE